ncbi:DUF4142 domain-containing protein [Caldimonas brevitalea]|uniref:Membrane protein n=1 Tax=Caldimonas brevitalea TaxID=413882 RepID=A0A0G3BTA0_9BURK|nr:DUF4142 domain-containing protein [Caldimonas brevitalea]AKJ30596.1 membrane protein [Caldimonas brevitalea]
MDNSSVAATGSGAVNVESPRSTPETSNRLAGGVVSASAQPPAAAASRVNASPLALVDQNFLTSAAAAGLFEMAASRAAADRATHADVKAYAAMLVKDHSAAHEDLRTLAARKSVNLPTEVPAGQVPTLEKLTNARGTDFDRAFVQTIGVSAHKTDISLFEKAANTAQDPEVRAWAAKILPKLREHLAAAQKLPGASGA